MTKITILAADGVKNWGRHKLKVEGETLLARTVRQLKERGMTDITISERFEGQHERISDVKYVVNPLTGNDLGCIMGCKGADIYLFGDVYFSDYAIDTILSGDTNFYGRTKKGIVKSYGEMFALKANESFMRQLEQMWEEYTSGKIPRLWSWDLYSRIQGKDFYIHRNTGNFTEINDITEDFDKLIEFNQWKDKHEKRS